MQRNLPNARRVMPAVRSAAEMARARQLLANQYAVACVSNSARALCKRVTTNTRPNPVPLSNQGSWYIDLLRAVIERTRDEIMQQRSSEAREEFLRQTHHAQDDDVEMELQVSSHPTGAKQSLGNVLLYPPWCDTHGATPRLLALLQVETPTAVEVLSDISSGIRFILDYVRKLTQLGYPLSIDLLQVRHTQRLSMCESCINDTTNSRSNPT